MANAKITVIDKLVKSQPLSEADCLFILQKATQPEARTIITENSDRIFVEIQNMCKMDPDKFAQSALYLASSLAGYNSTIDKQFYSNNLTNVIETLRILFSYPNTLLKIKNWETVAQLLIGACATDLIGKTKYYKDALPTVIKALDHPGIRASAVAIITQIALANPRYLVDYVDDLVPAVKNNNHMASCMADIYKQKPEVWTKHIPTIIQYFADLDPAARVGILTLLNPISETTPGDVKPICSNPDFKDCLFSKMTGSSAALVLRNIVNAFPIEFVDWIDDLVDACKTNDSILWAVYSILGVIGTVSQFQAKRVTEEIFKLIKTNMRLQTVAQALMAIKNVQSKFPTIPLEYTAVLKELAESSPYPEVKDLAKGIMATAESRDLDSLAVKLRNSAVDQSVNNNASSIKLWIEWNTNGRKLEIELEGVEPNWTISKLRQKIHEGRLFSFPQGTCQTDISLFRDPQLKEALSARLTLIESGLHDNQTVYVAVNSIHTSLHERTQEATMYIQNIIRNNYSSVDVGLLLGSGFESLRDYMNKEWPVFNIGFSDIPHFIPTTPHSNSGHFIIGKLFGKTVAIICGRIQSHQTSQESSLPVRVLKALGASVLFMCNPCGGTEYHGNDIVIIEDHINLVQDNSLTGRSDNAQRNIYDRELVLAAKQIAMKHDITTRTGVYAALPGGFQPTKAEINFLHKSGADFYGFGVVDDVLVAVGLGIKVLALGSVTTQGNTTSTTNNNILKLRAIIEELLELSAK